MISGSSGFVKYLSTTPCKVISLPSSRVLSSFVICLLYFSIPDKYSRSDLFGPVFWTFLIYVLMSSTTLCFLDWIEGAIDWLFLCLIVKDFALLIRGVGFQNWLFESIFFSDRRAPPLLFENKVNVFLKLSSLSFLPFLLPFL